MNYNKKYRLVNKFVQEEKINAPVYFVHWFKRRKKKTIPHVL